jgi:hypothetical protein
MWPANATIAHAQKGELGRCSTRYMMEGKTMEPLTRVTLARLLNVTPGTITLILAKNGWTPQRRRAKKQTLTESQVICVLRNFFVIDKDEMQQPKIREDDTAKSCYVRTDDSGYSLQVYSDVLFLNRGSTLPNEAE